MIFFSLGWEPGGFILVCMKGEAAQGPFCQRCPVSLSPPLCLDAFETGREGMWLRECTLGDEWLHVFELFLKYRLVFTPACPPLQDASKQSGSAVLQLSGLIIKAPATVGLFIRNEDCGASRAADNISSRMSMRQIVFLKGVKMLQG